MIRLTLLSFSSFPRRRETSRSAVLNWVPAFAGMTGMILASCSASQPEQKTMEALKPTLKLEEPTTGAVQCYTDEDGDNSPSMAFSFDEGNQSAKDLLDESQSFEVEYNTASIVLNFDRQNIMDTDRCKWLFNRLSGDGGLYCMLAETDNYQQEIEFKCQPLGKRKF